MGDTGYYVTAVLGRRVFYMRGPFEKHETALNTVEETRRRARDIDMRAVFAAWGTTRAPTGRTCPMNALFAGGEA